MPHVEKDKIAIKFVGIKLVYYRKNDWKRFMKIIDDREICMIPGMNGTKHFLRPGKI